MLPLPPIVDERAALETPLMLVSVALAVAGLVGAAWLYGGDAGRARRFAERFPALHRLLSGKYYVDEAYDRLVARPLFWISDRVFLRLGDRTLLDGSLHGLAALSRRTAGTLARVQTGNLHLYAWLVLVGIVVSLAWSWPRG
jgi:NADH-quinone oxidoreductase subunit L